jgi:hypothetical protein
MNNGIRIRITMAAMACAAFLLTVAPASAHHAFTAEFDNKKPVKLHGVVTKMEWINPHSWIHIDVKGDDGKVVNWAIECGAPGTLLRRGFSRTSVPVGTEILVEGFQAKDGGLRANGTQVTLPDGQRLFLGSSNPDAADQKK